MSAAEYGAPSREARWATLLAVEGVAFAPDADGSPRGMAASLEPSTGEPQTLAVTPEGDAEAFWVDRRTMRLTHQPRTSLAHEDDVVRAADLADRVQLAIGEPVWVRYAGRAGKLCVTELRPLEARIRFTAASYRETAALIAETGTLAPLSIDALSRALRIEGDRGEEPRVRRLFARAYRRIDEHHTPWAHETRAGVRELGRLARLGRDVALAWNDARAFRSHAAAALARAESVALVALDRHDLGEVLEERMRLVTRALALLERSRLSTLSVLPLLEALCVDLPRELFDALSAPRRSPERAALDRQLVAFAARCRVRHGDLCVPGPAAPELSHEWEQLKQASRHVRMLGMDVRPRALGESDEDLLAAVREAWKLHGADPEAARQAAEPQLIKLAARGRLGALGAPPAAGLVLLLSRIADAKGALAEGLSAALLQLRGAALEAGRRLVSDGVLEQPEDTFFMPLQEIEEALDGELGAYAARVRLRREDDRRWRNFAAPRWIEGRRSEPALP